MRATQGHGSATHIAPRTPVAPKGRYSGGRAYLQWVEAYRNAEGAPRQRMVANPGRLDRLSEKELAPLIGGLERAIGRKPSTAPKVEFEAAKAFGDLHALQQLWRELGLADALARALRSSRRQFDAAALIRTMVFNRLCAADSKLGVLRWLDTVAMPDVPSAITHDQLLRATDALMDGIERVERAVAAQLRPLLDDTLSVVFHDLTTIRIHGTGKVADDVRAFGLSKDTGGIDRQFVLGVVQTADGLPIAHQVHAGNMGEGSTLPPMIERTLKRYPIRRVVLIADRGLLSLDNLTQIEALKTAKGEPLEYILAVPGRRYGEFADLIAATALAEGLGETVWQQRRLVAAHDEERAQIQHAARKATLAGIEAESERMAKRLDNADAGVPIKGRNSNDRRAYLRFSEAVKAAGLSRILKADLDAEMFNFELDPESQRTCR